MLRVNFSLRVCLVTLLWVYFAPSEASARNYVPARKIGTKPQPNAQAKTIRPFTKPKIPLSQQNRSSSMPVSIVRRETSSSENPYAPSRRGHSSYFQRKLAGPYVAGGLGVQMHRHDGIADDGTQKSQFDTNDQGVAFELALGWIFTLPQYYFAGAEIALNPVPLKTSMNISDKTTVVSVKGKTGFSLAGIFGRHFLEGGAIAYARLGLEWRQFNYIYNVEDNANDDINDDVIVFGFSPGVGIGFWILDNLYMVGEYRTTFFQKTKLKSPNGARLTLTDTYPRVDVFLLKFIMPLNRCFGTQFGVS